MGRHSKVQPKKISLLATVGGLFATVLLAAGLFGVGSLIHSQHTEAKMPERVQISQTTSASVINSPTVVPTQNDINTSIQNVPTIIKDVPGSKQSPATPRVNVTIAPTVAEVPVGVDVVASVGVRSELDTVSQAVKDIISPITDIFDN